MFFKPKHPRSSSFWATLMPKTLGKAGQRSLRTHPIPFFQMGTLLLTEQVGPTEGDDSGGLGC